MFGVIKVHYNVVKIQLMSLVSASEAFFDNLTVEQEFMTGVDTDKVFFIDHKNDSRMNMYMDILRLVFLLLKSSK